MNFCQQCGAKKNAGDTFCTSCGAPIPEVAAVVRKEPPRTGSRKVSPKTIGIALVALLAIVGGVAAAMRPGVGLADPPPAPTTTVHGTVRPPAGVSLDSLEIVGLAAEGTLDADGTFTVKAYEDGVSVSAAMVKGKEFGLMRVLVTGNGADANPVMDVRSTAASLVFMTPFLQTNDPEEAKAILSVIDADPRVSEFADVIASVFDDADPMDDPAYERALAAAVESVLTTLNP